MQTQQSSMKQHEILIVDDTPENITLLSQLFKKRGYAVQTAATGELALQSIRTIPPDLVLLDIMMPDMDGYEICRQLKADTQTREIPVIFLSALIDSQYKVKAFESGGIDYITKPFQTEEVIVRVQTHLTIQELYQHIRKQNVLLREQNVRFRTLEEASFEGIIVHNELRILEANRRFEEIFGYRRSEIVGKSPLYFIAPSFHDVTVKRIRSKDETPYQVDGVRKDGTRFLLEVQSRSMPHQGREVRVVAIRDLSHQNQLEQENRALKATMKERYRFGKIIGKSKVMQTSYELITKAAATQYGVIIYGESGTGKELVARTIHHLSDREEHAFVPVNCGAVTETLFEREFFGHRKGAFTGAVRDTPGFFDAARGGTLFLDEIGELSPVMQVKLLRVLDTGGYTPVGDTKVKQADVRIIAATNQNLEASLQQGTVREDFFYRIHVIAITIPPLRDRREDIPLLIDHIMQQENSDQSLPTLPLSVIDRLSQERWPGNVRQLQNTLQHYLTTGELVVQGSRLIQVGEEDNFPEGLGLSEAMAQFEKRIILQALERNGGNKTATAAMLRITRRGLYKKLKKYGIG